MSLDKVVVLKENKFFLKENKNAFLVRFVFCIVFAAWILLFNQSLFKQ